MDIYNSVVKKPWGEEYCAYKEDDISLWVLTINPDKKTSLHCHPKKKTGLIVLNGIAQINLIERHFQICGPSKINLRNSIFHQTHNVGKEPMFVLEVETPNDKFDLVRIDDDYGRENTEFENDTKWVDLPKENFQIPLNGNAAIFNGYWFQVTNLEKSIPFTKDRVGFIVLLDKYAFTDKKGNGLCELGDVISFSTFNLLREKFTLCERARSMLIWK